MALITAQATLYNAFKCRLVDKNISANLTATVTMGHRDPNNVGQFLDQVLPSVTRRVRNQVFRSNSDLTAEGLFGVQNLSAAIVAESSLNLVIPTYVEINWDLLEIPEGKNVTIKLEQGFVIEDRNKFPFALGLPLTADDNLITFRTPKRLNPMQLSSTANSSLVPLRIKPLSAPTFNSSSGLSALPIYNPGRLAALFGGNFITTTAPVKTARTASSMAANSNLDSNSGKLLDPSPTSYFSNFNISLPETFKLRLFESVNNEIISTVPSVDSMRLRGISDNFTSETESAVSAMRFRDPSAAIAASHSLAANALYTGSLKQTYAFRPTVIPEFTSWRSVTSDSLGNVYLSAIVGSSIYKRSPGANDFELFAEGPTDVGSIQRIVCASDNSLYVCFSTVSQPQTPSLYRIAAGTTTFVNLNFPLIQSGAQTLKDVALHADGTIYAVSTGTVAGTANDKFYRKLPNQNWEERSINVNRGWNCLTVRDNIVIFANSGTGLNLRYYEHLTGIALSSYGNPIIYDDSLPGTAERWEDLTILPNKDILGTTSTATGMKLMRWQYENQSLGFVQETGVNLNNVQRLFDIAYVVTTGEVITTQLTQNGDIYCIKIL